MLSNQPQNNAKRGRIGKKITRLVEATIFILLVFLAYVVLTTVIESRDRGITRILYIVLGAIVIGIIIGRVVARWYVKKQFSNITLLRVIGFSNLIAWLFPPLGFFVFSLTINLVAEERAPQWYRALYLVNLLLSAGNAYWGFFLSLSS